MIHTRRMKASVEVDVCDACGAERMTTAVIGGERFTNVHGAIGFPSTRLWSGHPLWHKQLCYECRDAGKEIVDGVDPLPPGARRAMLIYFDDRDGDEPPDRDRLRREGVYAVALGEDRTRGVLLVRQSQYYLPILAVDALGFIASSRLVDGERTGVVLQAGSDEAVTVAYELTEHNWRSAKAVQKFYGAECARRMRQYDSEHDEALEVTLRLLRSGDVA